MVGGNCLKLGCPPGTLTMRQQQARIGLQNFLKPAPVGQVSLHNRAAKQRLNKKAVWAADKGRLDNFAAMTKGDGYCVVQGYARKFLSDDGRWTMDE
jgi:hypothetical protein